MTLDELLSTLNELKAERPDADKMDVATEGCDCDGDVGDVCIEYGRVYLCRAR
jgi:hypothetical protein